MTKAKLHETVINLCEEHEASPELTEALSELTKPKVGGSSDVNDYTVYDEDGNVTHIYCTFHKQWEPLTKEGKDGETESLFVEDAKSKNGFKRSCKEGAKQWGEAAKIFKTSKDAIMTDVLDEKITGEQGKEQLAELEKARDERPARTDGLGEAEKPEGFEKPEA